MCGFAEVAGFQHAHRQRIEEALTRKIAVYEDRWSEATAVSSVTFVDKMKRELGYKAKYREVTEVGGTYTLREHGEAYASNCGNESDALMLDNTVSW